MFVPSQEEVRNTVECDAFLLNVPAYDGILRGYGVWPFFHVPNLNDFVGPMRTSINRTFKCLLSINSAWGTLFNEETKLHLGMREARTPC